MSIVLTEEQQRQIDVEAERPAEVVDPRTGRRFALVPSEEYEAMRDRDEREAWARMSMQTMARRLKDDE